MTLTSKWLLNAILGLLLLGAGLSMAIDAGTQKAAGTPYFWYGTGALVVFMSGINFFGQAIIYRIKLNQRGD